jgi:hypothetical protein
VIPTDTSPPPDRERAPVRVSLTSAILIGLVTSALAVAVTWGANGQRITALEQTAQKLQEQGQRDQEQIRQLRELVAQAREQTIELKGFTADAIRRLERIEGKIDYQERRR